MDLESFKAQNPVYSDMTDADLAKGLHAKYYADVPFEDFAKQINFSVPQEGSILKSGLAKGMQAFSDVATTIQAKTKSPYGGFKYETDIATEQTDRANFWADMVKQYEPDYNPEKPVSSTLRRATSSAVGLAMEKIGRAHV